MNTVSPLRDDGAGLMHPRGDDAGRGCHEVRIAKIAFGDGFIRTLERDLRMGGGNVLLARADLGKAQGLLRVGKLRLRLVRARQRRIVILLRRDRSLEKGRLAIERDAVDLDGALGERDIGARLGDLLGPRAVLELFQIGLLRRLARANDAQTQSSK